RGLHGRVPPRRRGLPAGREPLSDLRRRDELPGVLPGGVGDVPRRARTGGRGRADRAHRAGRPALRLPDFPRLRAARPAEAPRRAATQTRLTPGHFFSLAVSERKAMARRTAGGVGAPGPLTACQRISFSSKSSARSTSLKSIFADRSAP